MRAKAPDRARRRIGASTLLDAPADVVWRAMRSPATFRYVVRGVLGIPKLAARVAPFEPGESVSFRIFLFHVIPAHRHHLTVARVDDATRTIQFEERGGVIRSWRHVASAEPVDETMCRYTDVIEFDAGRWTGAVARLSKWIYRYRHHRWRRLSHRIWRNE